MTEPDEALLYARERAKRRFSALSTAGRAICAQIDAGKHDGKLEVAEAQAYRAGQSASAERIKALEEDARYMPELLAALEAALQPGYTPWVQAARALVAKVRSQHAARNPLKEADQ